MDNDKQVLVVPAGKFALDDYLDFSLYFCQPYRTFQPSYHLALYANQSIYHQLPRILAKIEHVVLTKKAVDGLKNISLDLQAKLQVAVHSLSAHGSDRYGEAVKVMLLTPPTSDETVTLPQNIPNDLKAASGRTVAFVQAQRYVPLARFTQDTPPTSTSDLLD